MPLACVSGWSTRSADRGRQVSTVGFVQGKRCVGFTVRCFLALAPSVLPQHALVVWSASGRTRSAGGSVASPRWRKPGQKAFQTSSVRRVGMLQVTLARRTQPRIRGMCRKGDAKSDGVFAGAAVTVLRLGSTYGARRVSNKVSGPLPRSSRTPSDLGFCGAPGRIRTCDRRIRSPMLYPLSYGCLIQLWPVVAVRDCLVTDCGVGLRGVGCWFPRGDILGYSSDVAQGRAKPHQLR